MIPSAARRAQGGFTLVELLIAMTLAALIVALGADILRTGMDFYQRAHQHIRQQQEMRGFFRLLRQELQGGARKVTPLGGQPGWFAFSTQTLPQSLNWPGRNQVLLTCRTGEGGNVELVHGIQLTRTAIANKLAHERILAGVLEEPSDVVSPPVPTEEDAAAPYHEEVLVNGLTGCVFSFLVRVPNPDSPQPVAAWVDEWPQGKGGPPPLAVRVQLTLPGGGLPPVVIPL